MSNCQPTCAEAEVEDADVVRVLVGHDEPLSRRVELEVARRGAPRVLVRRTLRRARIKRDVSHLEIS